MASIKDQINDSKKLAESQLENAKDSIESRFGGDKEQVKKAIPQSVRKYLGFDY